MNAHLVHTGGLATERAALRKASRSMQAMKDRILSAIEAAGPDGLTPDEWAKRNNALINTVRRRFTDLWKEGMIRHEVSITRANDDGNECVAWVIGHDPNGLGRMRYSAEVLKLRALLERCEPLIQDRALRLDICAAL